MQLQSALTSRNEHCKVVVVATLTNPITCCTFLGGDQLINDVRLFLQQVCSWIQQGRAFDDGTNSTVLILPPQFRLQPCWYRQYYTTVLAIFEEVFRAPGPQIWILPPFMDPEFEDDGYHYTSPSGHLYIHHLINSAHQILRSSVKPDPTAQVHTSQLQGVRSEISELRFKQVQVTAKQEEEVDGRLNTESEDQFVIAGLSVVKSDSWRRGRIPMSKPLRTSWWSFVQFSPLCQSSFVVSSPHLQDSFWTWSATPWSQPPEWGRNGQRWSSPGPPRKIIPILPSWIQWLLALGSVAPSWRPMLRLTWRRTLRGQPPLPPSPRGLISFTEPVELCAKPL